MTLVHSAGVIALMLLAPHTAPTMTEDSHALTLDVQEHDGAIEVRLVGNAAHTQEVSYLIEVTGQSTSRHRGRTTLKAGNTVNLSTMRASVGADWCVKLVAEEAGREPYEIIEGSCAADAE